MKSLNYMVSDVYILVSVTIKTTGAGANDAAKRLDCCNEGAILKNCSPFTDWKTEINNIQLDNSKYIDAVMQICNFIESKENYLRTTRSV